MTVPAYQPIEAAGAVLWREVGGEELVALVHRPAYDDWSLPKGKARRGEHPLLVALREVQEETGFEGVLGVPLPDQRYEKEGRPKVVHLHAMEATSGESLDPEVEVDDVRWMPLPEAVATATWERDRDSLRHFAVAHRPTTAVMLLRHASAGERKLWDGNDTDRPLDEYGMEQSTVLAPLLAAYAPGRLISSPAVRCLDTLAVFADERGVQVELDTAFSEDDYDPVAAERLLDTLLASPTSSVVCTHGPVLIDVLERRFARLGQPPSGAARVPKGGAWVIHTDGRGTIVNWERIPAP